MFTALLLLLTASATPAVAPESFLLLQEPAPQGEPFLQWNGETEDVYRRALHLWKVRGKPAEAAELLLGIADSAEVLQIAGQSSWVLVLAAQCLAEAGRSEEAAALIPGIERGAKGTQLEAVVTAELTILRDRVAGGRLDEAFLDSLIELLNREHNNADAQVNAQLESGRQSRIQGYHRTVLPYLLEVVERWPSEGVRQSTVYNAIRYGLGIADAQFIDGLIAGLEELTSLSFLSVFPTSHVAFLDELAQRETTRLYVHLSRHEDVQRIRVAKMLLGRQAFREEG